MKFTACPEQPVSFSSASVISRLFFVLCLVLVLVPLDVYANRVNNSADSAVSQLVAGHSTVKKVIKQPDGSKAVIEKNAQAEQPLQKTAKSAIVFQSLSQLNELIHAGLPSLALGLLNVEQKKRPAFTASWYAFEYKRIVIYAAKHDWSTLVKRVSWLLTTAVPGEQITEKIRLWFETQQIIARLHSGQAEKALQQLRRLIWTQDVTHIDKTLPALWRRLIIRAYMTLKMDEDAQKALVKYDQDFPLAKMDNDWKLLQVRILLRTHRPGQAEKILSSMNPDKLSSEIQTLWLLAKLQSAIQVSNRTAGINKIKAIRQIISKKLNGQKLSPAARWAYSYVAFQVAEVLNDNNAQISSLENALSQGVDYPVLGKNYTLSADELWRLYESRGLQIANAHNLLIGDDSSWLALIKTIRPKSARDALYLNAALAQNTRNKSVRQQCNVAIVKQLKQRKNGAELINQLYLHSQKIHDYTVLPASVRYLLIDYALNKGDIAKAALVMNGLTEPPQGEDAFNWRMRKARILVLQGDYAKSVTLLKQTMAVLKSLKANMLDHYLQVVFDFQTVQQNRKALVLFNLIKPQWLTDKSKREIFFWKAESFSALKNYQQAALYYLRSANIMHGQENDFWAQAARFKAAGVLVKAGIYADAEKVYIDLLAITASESRKLLIRQRIQRIRLLRSAGKHRSVDINPQCENITETDEGNSVIQNTL